MSRARRATTASTVSAEGPVAIGEGGTQEHAAARQAARPRGRAADRVGRRARRPSKVAITGPGDFALERSYVMNVKPATQVLARRTVKPIAKGESLTLSSDLFADLVPGTGAVALSVGASTALDAASAAQGARPLSLWLLRADHQPGDAAALRQRAGERRASGARRRRSTSASATPSIACWRASRRTARSASGASAATTPGSTPTSPTS